jgi:NAD(P)H-nitrite reductase large subunit
MLGIMCQEKNDASRIFVGQAPMTQPSNPPDAAAEVLCNCSGTTRGEIVRLHEQGLGMDGISRRTGAITGCGGCEWDIADLLHALVAKRGDS